jgi:hypothetical protein
MFCGGALKKIIIFAWALLLLSGAAAALPVPEAFSLDGWNVTATAQSPAGTTGYAAVSLTATTLDTGRAKKALYVAGTGRDMGFLVGSLAARDVAKMAVTYVSQLPIELVARSLFERAQKSKRWRKVYDAVVYLLGDILVAGANGSFQQLLEAGGYFPDALVQEMHGIVEGCQAVDPDSPVTFDRIVTLNYGIDFLLAHAYSGKLAALVARHVPAAIAAGAIAETTAGDVVRFLRDPPRGVSLIRDVTYCDAFGISPQRAWSRLVFFFFFFFFFFLAFLRGGDDFLNF